MARVQGWARQAVWGPGEVSSRGLGGDVPFRSFAPVCSLNLHTAICTHVCDIKCTQYDFKYLFNVFVVSLSGGRDRAM